MCYADKDLAAPFQVAEGLATLGPQALRIKAALETTFLGWAAEVGAEARIYPPLLKVEDLSRVDYFQNFPHLAVLTGRLRPDVVEAHYADESAEPVSEIPAEHLTVGQWALPSAACYPIYFELRGRELSAPHRVTTVATCFRNEEHFDDLRRLWSFSMREIVCVGSAESVKEHLEGFKVRILDFAASLDLELGVDFAADPFFRQDGSRAMMQKLFPQKREFLYGDLAIGSLNFHRNFFGERCDIRMSDGGAAFSGCVAFGLERWIHSLLDRHGDVDSVLRRLSAGG